MYPLQRASPFLNCIRRFDDHFSNEFTGFAGLCLSYALTLTSAQVFLTRFYSYLENYIISVERIKQYMHLPSEPPAVIPDNRPPISWPQEGRIDLQDLKVNRISFPYYC
jgi:hypothetical protein